MSERRERLAALKKAKEASESAKATSSKRPLEADVNDTSASVSFRNYRPVSDKLQDQTNIVESGDLDRIKDSIKKVESEVDEFSKKALEAENERRQLDMDLTNIAPKKANWDLKKLLEEKMEPLNAQTSIAIVELINEKIQKR